MRNRVDFEKGTRSIRVRRRSHDRRAFMDEFEVVVWLRTAIEQGLLTLPYEAMRGERLNPAGASPVVFLKTRLK